MMQPADAPLQSLTSPLLDLAGVELQVKRLDLVHPIVSGNKWYKLKYNLREAQSLGYQTVLSFGGAYSNHIHAMAGACKALGLGSIGIIRGEPHHLLNTTLAFAEQCGMQLHYLNRNDYRQKHTSAVIDQLCQQYGDFYLVPEGGSNALALQGVAEVVSELPSEFDILCCACGSGGTLAGLIKGLAGSKHLLGFSALKGGDFLYDDISHLLAVSGVDDPGNWAINLDYHFGGFAKTRPELIEFIYGFEQAFDIPLEPLYTGKLFYGLFDLIERGYFERGSRIIALHSGGLQGRASLMK